MSVIWTHEADQEFAEYFFDPGIDERPKYTAREEFERFWRGFGWGVTLTLFVYAPFFIWYWRTK